MLNATASTTRRIGMEEYHWRNLGGYVEQPKCAERFCVVDAAKAAAQTASARKLH